MLIRSLHLRNIRSYVDQDISFEPGSTLLAGDIGSGKTTILLALEFAIFGFLRGTVSGGDLLRHGESTGSVKLDFEVGGKEVVIQRSLKRSSSGIVQASGYLTVDGKRFDGTPSEIKARVLELLGYPESLLTKSKSLIFRFTVFTPQDEMKRILYENKEERLDVLRRLFDIEKYKLVKDNAAQYLRELKISIAVLDGKLQGLPDKQETLSEQKARVSQLNSELANLDQDFSKLKIEVAQRKQELDKAESAALEEHKAQLEFARAKEQEKSLRTQQLRLESDLSDVEREINSHLATSQGFDPGLSGQIKAKIVQTRTDIEKSRTVLESIQEKRTRNQAKLESARALLEQIESLEVCPTCQQQVSRTHKEQIKTKENVTISDCGSNIAKLEDLRARLTARIKDLQAELDKYAEDEKSIALIESRFAQHQRNLKKKASLLGELSSLNEQLKALATAPKQPPTSALDAVSKARTAHDQSLLALHALERGVVEKKATISAIKTVLAETEKELSRLHQDEIERDKLRKVRDWLDASFTPLVSLIETNTLGRVHTQFNSYFINWFSTLLEDESLSVRLDEYFSPVLEQNGYETTIENLSGGEKTSVALAYRLALNKVINEINTSINTSEILILDEPTEGFSSEQLARVKQVLSDVGASQVIIVSHETVMESFVDYIIRVEKHNHVSHLGKI